VKQTTGWDETTKPKAATASGWDARHSDDRLSLKEKIKLLTGGGNVVQDNDHAAPTSEEIGKIESANFVQEKFSSTYIDPSAMPKQKKKKKNKSKQQHGGVSKPIKSEENETSSNGRMNEIVSHEDAMFSNTMDTLHVTKFSSHKDFGDEGDRRVSPVEEDSIFGAMFFDDPDVRKKRWISKLTKLRKKFAEEGA